MHTLREELLHEVLRQEQVKALFQPIIHLQTRQIYGHEGLIRGPLNTVLHAPTPLYEATTSAGRLEELDLLCRRVVIKRFAQLGLSGRLFINVDPYSLLHEITKLQVNRAQHANPLTLLPGNVPIQQELQLLFEQGIPFVVCYFDLDLADEAAIAKHRAKEMQGTSLYIHEMYTSSLSQTAMDDCGTSGAEQHYPIEQGEH